MRFVFTGGESPITICRTFHSTARPAVSHFSRDAIARDGRCDLRRPAGYPAAPRVFAQGGARGIVGANADAALPDSQCRELLPSFSFNAAAARGNPRVCGYELPSKRRLRIEG